MNVRGRELSLAGGALIGGAIVVSLVLTLQTPQALTEQERRQLSDRIRLDVQTGELLYGLAQPGFPLAVSFQTEDPANSAEAWCAPDPAGRWRMGVRVNDRMAAQNWKRFLKQTVPHEVAHLLMCEMGLSDWQEHGGQWATIVRDQGAVPYPYHSYRTEQ